MIEGRPAPSQEPVEDEVPTDGDAPGEHDPVEPAPIH